MNYHNITKEDMNNGDGLRVVLWVAGCEHHCPECHNMSTWSYDSGIEIDADAIKEIARELDKDYVSGITFSGGDPLAPHNRASILALIFWVRVNYPTKTIWLYTGYTYEQIADSPMSSEVLLNIDVLVDGKYVKELRDVNLKWRGSKNQRVIDVRKSIKERKVVLHCD